MKIREKQNVKTRIKIALLDLMMEKPYMEITVTDIIKKAEVARVSYYRNFQSIDEILDSIVEEKVAKIKGKITPMMNADNTDAQWIEFLRTVFEHKQKMYESLTFTQEINRPYLSSKMNEHMQEDLSIINNQTIEEKYLLPAKMGIVNSLADVWVKSGTQESVEQMADVAFEMIKKL